ncbi:hypothetical protein [Polycladidibacter hongkongensis]|uniref:hypothetical protein n=1 Tax=Polycladidibacter hongkongensis TaxID=1647556 RepID=UPI00082ED271|nr:hypothetical protein [Pseudovibrio hongkongensis]
MADYYSVLKKTIAGLQENNGSARRAVYSRARAAIVNQLKNFEPPLAPAQITAEQLKLEECIRKVEAEAARETLGLSAKPSPASEFSADSVLQREPTAVANSESELGAAQSSPSASEPEETAAAEEEIVPQRASALQGDSTESASETGGSLFKRAFKAAGALSAQTSPDKTDITQSPVGDTVSAPLEEPKAADTAKKRGQAWASFVKKEEAWEPGKPRRAKGDEASKQGANGEEQAGSEAAAGVPYLSEGLQPSRTPRLIGLVLVALVLLVGGYGLFSLEKDDWAAMFGNGSNHPVATESAGTPPSSVQSTPPAAPRKKREDRLLQDDSARVAPDATAVKTTRISALPNAGGSTAATGSVPPAQALQDSQPKGIEGYRTQLFEGALQDGGRGRILEGHVVWSLEEVSGKDPVIKARVDVPGNRLKASFTISINRDDNLPASHVVEIEFDVPQDFSGEGIQDVAMLLARSGEEENAKMLRGASAPVSNNLFWLALSDLESEKQDNLSLLKSREFLELPMVYRSGQRALLSMQKGERGQQVFAKAMQAWN